MILKIQTIAFLFFVLGCGVSKPSKNNSPVITKTVSTDCNTAIENFNRAASGNIKDEIAAINSTHRKIPEDLKELYPKARDAWNRALSNLKDNYSKEFAATSFAPLTIEPNSNWKSQSLEDYQVFFLLLTAYRYGDYPSDSKDTLKKMAWIEKADCKKRMERMVKHGLIARCENSIEGVRNKINPILLPDKIEDCLKNTSN